MTDSTRTRIQQHIETHPGIHFNELARNLNLASGQVQYHLHRLTTTNSIARESFYGQTHYYPHTTNQWERRVLALARRETCRDVIFDLLEHEPTRPGAVATRVDIARSTLEWHLNHLLEQDIVQKQRQPNNHVTLVLVKPQATLDALGDIEPSLSDRLVDRFERLVDQFFTDG